MGDRKDGEIWILGLVAGIRPLAVGLTYKLGEVLFRREAGLVGALLTALLMLQVEYSHRPALHPAGPLLAGLGLLFGACPEDRSPPAWRER